MSADRSELAAALGLGEHDDFTSATFEAIGAAAEERIALCMINEGFEYVPLPTQGSGGVPVSDDPVQFAQDHGFGLTGVLTGDVIPIEAKPAKSDPNLTALSALSPAEQEQWREQFNSCFIASNDAASEMLVAIEPISAAYADITERALADSEVQQLRQTWQTCMADAGFPQTVDTPERVVEPFQEEVRVLVARLESARLGVDGNISIDDEASIPPQLVAQVEVLRQLEIGTAVADQRCASDYYDKVSEVQAALERKYVEGNEETIRQFSSAFDR